MVTKVLPLGRRTSWARPPMSCPAPAAKAWKSPRATTPSADEAAGPSAISRPPAVKAETARVEYFSFRFMLLPLHVGARRRSPGLVDHGKRTAGARTP